MSRRILPVLAVAGCLVLTACGGGGGSAAAGNASPTLTGGDDSACRSLNDDTQGGNDAVALNTDFGLNGRRTGALSTSLKPYVQLVGSEAQLIVSGADDGKLGEYVGQMRGVCESLGWRASS